MSKASDKKRAPAASKKSAPKGAAKPKDDKELSDDELDGVSGGLTSASPTLRSALSKATRTPGA